MKILFAAALVLQITNAAFAQHQTSNDIQDSSQFYHSELLLKNKLDLGKEEDVDLAKKKWNKKRKWIIAGGIGLLATTYFVLDEPLCDFAQYSRTNISNTACKMIEPLGRTKYLVPAAGASLLGGVLFRNKRMRDAGVISIASILANCVITQTLKEGFRRHRPSVSGENDQFDGPFLNTKNSAFPSSHTSNAFALATSVAYVYRDVEFIPPLAFGIATLVGVSRIHDNAHWATDVAAGAAVGYLTSKGIIYLHKWIDQKIMSKKKLKLMATPMMTHQSIGLNATLVF
jgi:membrane-associated phospholipid phosphatase